MSVLIGLILTVGLLLAAVLNNIYIGFPLALGYVYFFLLYLAKGRTVKQLCAMSSAGAKKAFIVIPILLLIGCVVSSWMAAGTVGALVYYSLSLISPPLFIFFAFLLSSLISMLLGTALGTAGTIGVILMVLARGGGVDPYVTAGAIISGIYVGDRCSPMSSAIYLLSSVTGTDNYANIKILMKTTLPPFLLTAALYLAVSFTNPLLAGGMDIKEAIWDNFTLGFAAIIPALVMILLACFKINVRISMLVSAVGAVLLAILVQGVNAAEMLLTLWRGFHLPADNPLAAIIRGGGMWNMVKTGFILLAACALTSMLEGAGAMSGLQRLLLKPANRFRLYLKTMLISLLGICCGCNQSIAIVLAGDLLKQPYELAGLDKYELARDISYTAIPLASVIPWSVAAMVPMTTLGIAQPWHLPYLFYPLMVPLYYAALYAYRQWREMKTTKIPGGQLH